MLKLIYQTTIRNKVKGRLQLKYTEFFSVISKKQLRPRARQQFHGHRMYFRCFHCGACIFTNLHIAGLICRKCMTRFMCQHIHIARGTVKIRENERRLIIRQFRTITAACFILFTLQIEQLVFSHKGKKL